MTDTPVGNVTNPVTVSQADNTNPWAMLMGHQGELLNSELHGKYYTAAYRGNSYSYSYNAITLPVNASALVSKAGLINPASSGKNIEIVRIDWAYALATTVVNGVGVYTLNAVNTGNLTSVTAVTPNPMNPLNPMTSIAEPFSTATAASGITPTQVALIGYTGAVTSTAANVNQYNFDGSLIVPPGCSLHVAMTVAASTSSGFSACITWNEWPL